MKQLIMILVTMMPWLACHGQSGAARQKIESARIALITERLDLTPEQAQQFWPLYNEFISKRKELKATYDEARAKVEMTTASESEKKELLDLGLRLKEEAVQLERQYSDRMLTVIDAKQIMALRQAEEDFRNILLEQIQKRRMRQERREQIRDRMNDRVQRRRDN